MQKMTKPKTSPKTKPMIPMAIVLITSTATAQFLTLEEQRSMTPYERESLRIQQQIAQDSAHREIQEGLDRLERNRKESNARILRALRRDDYRDSRDSYGFESQHDGFSD